VGWLSESLNRFRRTAEVIADNNRYFRNLDRSKKLADYSFVVYDTELTGLNQRKDEIISIGAVRIRGMRIELGDTFHYYVRPRNLDHTKATLIHRITPEQLRTSPPLEDVLPLFINFIRTDLLVGHFVQIDTAFLNRATRRVYNGVIANPNLDTMRMAHIYKQSSLYDPHGRVQLENGGYNLEKLSAELNLPYFEAHDALEDALQTAYLFIFLAKKLETIGIVTISDLFRAGRRIDWSSMGEGSV